MESNDSQLSSIFQHTTAPSQPNGLLGSGGDGSHSQSQIPYPPPPPSHSQSQPVKKKRGRPRKYESPEQALAAKKAASASSLSSPPPASVKSPSSSSSSLLGIAGQGFTPHVISVAADEDVGQKIMLFMQQSRCGSGICILSASGSISNISLRQPATSGGSVTYEGHFEIISLSGSYVHNELGRWSGGLSVCLSDANGQMVGGGIAGPLKAAGPVQVIVGTFFIDPKKDTNAGIKGDVSNKKLPPPPNAEPVSSLGYCPTVEPSGGNPIQGNEEHQAIGGNQFMLRQHSVHVTPSAPLDWGDHSDSRNAGFELTGRADHGAHQSAENGNYE